MPRRRDLIKSSASSVRIVFLEIRHQFHTSVLLSYWILTNQKRSIWNLERDAYFEYTSCYFKVMTLFLRNLFQVTLPYLLLICRLIGVMQLKLFLVLQLARVRIQILRWASAQKSPKENCYYYSLNNILNYTKFRSKRSLYLSFEIQVWWYVTNRPIIMMMIVSWKNSHPKTN
jgi:hypothetical protein